MLITFETAKLAKRKEFAYDKLKELPSYVPIFYCETHDNSLEDLDLSTLKESECQGEDITREDFFYRSTQSELQKWLREVHNIHISIIPKIFNTDEPISYFIKVQKHNCEIDICGNKTYEESLEEGLLQALKLINP